MRGAARTACADSGCGHLRTVCKKNCVQMSRISRMRDCLSIKDKWYSMHDTMLAILNHAHQSHSVVK